MGRVVGERPSSQHPKHFQKLLNPKSNTPTNFHPPNISPKASTNLREYFAPGVIWKSMDSLIRKRNVSDGDSGFDSALSSRSSSISLDESPEFGKLFHEDEELLNAKLYFPTLKDKFSNILTLDEDIRHDDETDDLFVIFNQVTGAETLYKPPSRLKFCQTGTVHFVLARPRDAGAEADTSKQENKCDESKAVLEKEDKIMSTKNAEEEISSDKKIFTNPGNAFLENVGDSFVGRDAVRLKSSSPLPVVPLQSGHRDMAEMSTFSKQLVLFGSLLLVSVYVTAFKLK